MPASLVLAPRLRCLSPCRVRPPILVSTGLSSPLFLLLHFTSYSPALSGEEGLSCAANALIKFSLSLSPLPSPACGACWVLLHAQSPRGPVSVLCLLWVPLPLPLRGEGNGAGSGPSAKAWGRRGCRQAFGRVVRAAGCARCRPTAEDTGCALLSRPHTRCRVSVRLGSGAPCFRFVFFTFSHKEAVRSPNACLPGSVHAEGRPSPS